VLITCQDDLCWLIPKDTTDANIDGIPPTIIYFNQKQVVLEICNALRELLPEHMHHRPPLPDPPEYGFDVRSPAEISIAAYYSDFSTTLKRHIHQQFVTGEARILVATTAYGFGIDIPHVQRVIQWGVTKLHDLDDLVQRFRRCGRSKTEQGMCILYYEQQYLGERQESSEGSNKHHMRDKMDQGLWSFINTRTCRRKAILDHYQDIDRAKDNLASGPCCDIHTGDDITKYPCGKGCPAFSEVQAVNYDAPSMPRPPATSQHLQEQVLEYLNGGIKSTIATAQ
jgi:superfamily II DNA/RNA helicase